MASIKESIFDYLTGKTQITDVVGIRIFPQIAPVSAIKPYIVYQIVVDPGHHHMLAAAKIASPTFQFDCYGESSPDAEETMEALRNVLDGLTRIVQTGLSIQRASLVNMRDFLDPPDDGSEIPTFRVSADYRIWYERAIPTGV